MMRVALTQQFIDEMMALNIGLRKKCSDLLGILKMSSGRNLVRNLASGWRLHGLEASPFKSFSLDMNYRVLVKIDGDTVYLHRVIKHDIAYRDTTLKNTSRQDNMEVGSTRLMPSEIYGAMCALGIPHGLLEALATVHSEDELLDALTNMDDSLALTALALYEMSPLVISKTKFRVFQDDANLEAVLQGEMADWEVYLHPSQRYIVEMPTESRIAVMGAAGTGKTVCAWHRIRHLVEQHKTAGFACSNETVLKISYQAIDRLIRTAGIESYYLVPRSPDELVQFAASVDHLVIDEGQEFPTTWLTKLFDTLRQYPKKGVTLFYDLNQLGGNIPRGDNRRYDYRLTEWESTLQAGSLLKLVLAVNYRNSREIAAFSAATLAEKLPVPLSTQVAAFEAGQVEQLQVSTSEELMVLLSTLLHQVTVNCHEFEIAIVYLSEKRGLQDVALQLGACGYRVVRDPQTAGLLVTDANCIRGYERKVIIVCLDHNRQHKKYGQIIDEYIAVTRARDRLFVIEMTWR